MTSSYNREMGNVFSVFDVTLAQTTPDVLGIWRALPPASVPELAFDTTEGTNEEIPCWRANLPADLWAANRCFRDSETSLLRFQQALLKVADRFASFTQAQFSHQVFSASAEERPEEELFHLLRTLEEPFTSFGISERASETWDKIIQQFQAWADNLLRTVAQYAWVETYAGEQFIGRTRVSWTGGMQTVWRAGLQPDLCLLHQRTLDLALATRNAALRLFLLVIQSSLKVSVLFAIPGGPLLLIPVVWQFVQGVLAEYKGA